MLPQIGCPRGDYTYFFDCFYVDLKQSNVLFFYMKKGKGKTIQSIFIGKFGLLVLIPVVGVLMTMAGLSVKSCISDKLDKLDRRAVLAEVQGARDRLHNVLVCRQVPWSCSDSPELRYTDRISALFVSDPSLVMELQKLYELLAVGKTHAEKLRQILESKEAHRPDTESLENAIRGVVAEADRVGPLLSAEVGGTWQEPPKNLTNEQLANHYLIKYKEERGLISAEHK